ncbi:MAG: Flagellar motor protein MotB [Candidatus Tokpelaia hoelldobleri]|uniref:Flagellar motor protein MotB n=1 Tax=Candidatus Tokpelaia hoelldobleri TaxID=1902579 RepID=A0A1U9JSX1_9HYPH|nr:MAG: Flagellar motor protein MotB [Candidatus Tokpelaia hoelldoblerii]
MDDPETHGEIIIIRRGHEGEEEHHGGVWKIAYADFMTAMMAFFLVMWLTNSASEETKLAVANYFNPLKLVDVRTNTRGLNDVANTPVTNGSNEISGSDTSAPEDVSSQLERDLEAKVTYYPFLTLKAIAGDGDIMLEGTGGASVGGSASGSASGTVSRDPFSPDYYKEEPAVDDTVQQYIAAAVEAGRAGNAAQTQGEKEDPAKADRNATEAALVQTGNGAADKYSENVADDKGAVDGRDLPGNQGTSDIAGKDGDTGAVAAQETESGKHSSLVDDIHDDLMKLMDIEKPDESAPLVRVTEVEDGVTIELMDNRNYGMFAIGSAKPDKKMIEILDGVARILTRHKGWVIISGHTDARPYKNNLHYDNWQLSSARAQMAYYMLVRGGLDEARVLRVEGYADRDLKNSEDPNAAENRRIGVFLKIPAGKDKE